jgi:hypothetical protein
VRGKLLDKFLRDLTVSSLGPISLSQVRNIAVKRFYKSKLTLDINILGNIAN